MNFLELEEEEELKNARKEAASIFRKCERVKKNFTSLNDNS